MSTPEHQILPSAHRKALSQAERREQKRAWRVKEWANAVGIGSTKCHALIRDKRVDSVLLDGSRLITTSPEAFLASLKGE